MLSGRSTAWPGGLPRRGAAFMVAAFHQPAGPLREDIIHGKIKVKTPSSNSTATRWRGSCGASSNKLILPYLDIDLKYYDLGMEKRDALTSVRQHRP
jgi:hypothetical protein